jgi:hypothetical protein
MPWSFGTPGGRALPNHSKLRATYALQRLQIFEQFLLVLVRQLSAIGVTFVTVTFFSRVEKEIRLRRPLALLGEVAGP